MSGAIRHHPGDMRIVDFGARQAQGRKLPHWTAVAGEIGFVSCREPKELRRVVTHLVYSVEEIILLEMHDVLRDTFPSVREGLPLWVIWAYEVDLRLKKYAPNEAGKWCETLPTFRADFELLQGLREGGLVEFPIENLANPKKLQKSVDQFLSFIDRLQKGLIAKYPDLKSNEFLGLLKLLEGAETALRSSFVFPVAPLTDEDVSSQFSSLTAFLNNFDVFSNGKIVSKFRTLFPENLRELDPSKERVIFENLCNAAYLAAEGYKNCDRRCVGLGSELNSSCERVNHLRVELAENHGFVEAAGTVIHTFKIYHQLWKCVVIKTWSQERQQWWNGVKECVNATFLCAGRVKVDKKDITSQVVQAVLKDPDVKDVFKSLLSIFGAIKEKREACLRAMDGFHQESNITLDFHNLYRMPFLLEAVAESLISELRKPLLNLEGHLQGLDGRRKELFVNLRALLQTIPLETLKAKKDKLIAHIRAFHTQASLPIVWSFQVLFQLSNLQLCEERYAFSEALFVGDMAELPNEMDPLVDYLALAGLERVFDQAIHDLTPKAAYVPPPQPQMAALEKAVSHQAAKPAFGQVDVPQAPPKAKKAPKAIAAGAAAAGAGAGAPKSAPNPDPVSDNAMRIRATSNDRKAVLKVLTDNGFVFWGFGGNHPLYRRGNERPVPVPLHSKTISHGVVHMLEKAAAGVFRHDAKDQKRQG